MEKSDLRKYVCVCRLLDSLTNLNAWSWNRLSLSQIFSFYVRPLLWLTLIHHDILYHTLIPYFPVTARTNGVPFLSSAQASLCLSHRREVGKREEKARKGRSEQRRTPPLLFFSYFYSRWNTQREPLWRREVFHSILHLKGQCPDYAHARASSVVSSKDNWTVILTRQDFLPDRTADGDLLFIFSSNILDFRRSLSSYINIWLAVRRLTAILSLAGPPCDPKISLRSL